MALLVVNKPPFPLLHRRQSHLDETGVDHVASHAIDGNVLHVAEDAAVAVKHELVDRADVGQRVAVGAVQRVVVVSRPVRYVRDEGKGKASAQKQLL